MAAGADRAHRAGRQLLGSASAICERALLPVHRNSTASLAAAALAAGPPARRREPRVQRRAGAREQLAAAHEIEHVVGVAAVGEAAPRDTSPPSRSWRRWYETRLWRCPPASHSSPTRRSLRASSLSSRQRSGWPASRRNRGGGRVSNRPVAVIPGGHYIKPD